MPPWVLIAANPYEGELCRKALRDTGIEVREAEDVPDALAQIDRAAPLAVVIADGWFNADARELLVEVRAADDAVPIFLFEDPESDIRDEEAARRRGASRLFQRPIRAEAVADALEALAVELERQAAANEQPLTPLTIEAEYALSNSDLMDVRDILPAVEAANGSAAAASEAPVLALEPIRPARTEVVGPPPRLPRERTAPILRMDEAFSDELAEPAVAAPLELVVEVRGAAEPPPAAARPAMAPAAIPARSTLARRLDDVLSEAERRLFPDSAPLVGHEVVKDYRDAMSDIDLDSLAVDTIPGISLGDGDTFAPVPAAAPFERLVGDLGTPPPAERGAPSRPLGEAGSLDQDDVAQLVRDLYAAGWSGRLVLSRGDGEKHLYFDGGYLVAATSSFAADRLGALLFRDGLIDREGYERAQRAEAHDGRRGALALIELGLLRGDELYPAMRRRVEHIFFSVFGWDAGAWALDATPPDPEDRVRPSLGPHALLAEGIRRKYALERLVERVGPPATVLSRTTTLERLIGEGVLGPEEIAVARLCDGSRSLGELLGDFRVRAGGLGEARLWALAWLLLLTGAARVGAEPSDGSGLREASTMVVAQAGERRQAPRDADEQPADREVERKRVRSKRAQLDQCDYFAALGLSRRAGPYEIERAWERLRREFDPARYHPEVREELAEALAEILELVDEAHRVLLDDHLRESYRAHLPPEQP
jgi:hypothetical protein